MATIFPPTHVPHSEPDYAPFAVLWTRDDCDRLEKLGFLDYHYELINGVIIRKMPQNKRHAYCVNEAIHWIQGAFDRRYTQTQSSIRVSTEDNRINKPEPDVALLNKPLLDVAGNQPGPEDMRLAIEVADSTRDMDLGTKATLYARAGVPEYWVVSVEERVIYVHTNPQPDGSYTRVSMSETETIAPSFAPDATVTVSDLLPPL